MRANLMITVYIIHSSTLDRYYSGLPKHLRRRLKEHRAGRTRSIPASQDWTVVWTQTLNTTTEARQLEKQIKARGAQRFMQDTNE